jgi:hypothetical protein
MLPFTARAAFAARRGVALTMLLAMPVASLSAQRATTATAAAQPASLTDGPEINALQHLRWRSIGPANQAGRISLVMGIP